MSADAPGREWTWETWAWPPRHPTFRVLPTWMLVDLPEIDDPYRIEGRGPR